MIRCPECGAFAWNVTAMQTHLTVEHWLPELKMDIIGGRRSDWHCQSPTHAQVMTMDCYSNVIPWQDEVIAILDNLYGFGGQAA